MCVNAHAPARAHFVYRNSDGKSEKEINHIIVYTLTLTAHSRVLNGRTKASDGGTNSGGWWERERAGKNREREITITATVQQQTNKQTNETKTNYI